MNYQELVKEVQTALVKADASAITEHIAVQVNVTGEAEGAFYIEIKDGVLYVEPYDYWDKDFLLTGSAEEILAVVQGKVSLVTAIADSRILHEGNPDKAIALGEIIPVKKTKKSKTQTSKVAEISETPKAEEKPAKRTRKTKAKDDTEEKPAKPKRTRKSKTTKTEENSNPEEAVAPIVDDVDTEVNAEVTVPVENSESEKPAKKTRKRKTSEEKTEVSVNSTPKPRRTRKPKKASK